MDDSTNKNNGRLTATRKGRQMIFNATELENMDVDDVTSMM
jgi:hypothetical protein